MRLPYNKPESALQRAEELLEVNAPLEALNILHAALGARRSRNFPVLSLEPLVFKFLSLTVTFRKGSLAREGLHFYKKLAQSAHPASVEKVVLHFLSSAESRVQEIRSKQLKETKLDGTELISKIDDLETSDTFDSKLTALPTSVREEEDVETEVLTTPSLAPRREKDGYTSIIAFLWEAYRMILDLLRNNAKFEILYQDTAKKAFEFCITYKRKTEFRRLSDALNVHLQALNRPHHAAYRQQPSQTINLSDPDVLQRFLDTRFLQLHTASELELWQESFRSAEDICGLLLKAADAIAPGDTHAPSSTGGLLPYSLFTNKRHGTKMMQMLVQYYEKLTRIFAFSDDPVFLAAAWNEYYSWTVNMKNAVPVAEENQRLIASHVLLSTLTSPIVPLTLSSETPTRHHRKDRLTKMLGWFRVPDRASLLADAAKKNIISYAHPVVRQLYRLLEPEFHPLTIAHRIRPLLSQLEDLPEFQKYIAPLTNVMASKVLQHLSSIFATISFEHLMSLVSVTPTPMSMFDLEQLVLQFNRSGEGEIRIHHASEQFYFQEKTLKIPPIDLLLRIPVYEKQDTLAKKEIFARARALVEKEHLDTHARQELIERKKQSLENYEHNQLKKAKEEALRKQLEEKEALQKKMAEAARQKELERIEKEQQAVKLTNAKQLSEALQKKAGIMIKSESLADLSVDELKKIQESVTKREREALDQEMSVVVRKLDHIERAIRKHEIPILEKIKEQEQEKNSVLAIELRKKAIEESKQRHAQALAIMKRVQRMRKEALGYRQSLMEIRKEYMETLQSQVEKEITAAKKQMREQVKHLIRKKIRDEKEAQRLLKEAELAQEEKRKLEEEEKRAAQMKKETEAKQVWKPRSVAQLASAAPPVSLDKKDNQPRPPKSVSDSTSASPASLGGKTESKIWTPVSVAQSASSPSTSVAKQDTQVWEPRVNASSTSTSIQAGWVPNQTEQKENRDIQRETGPKQDFMSRESQKPTTKFEKARNTPVTGKYVAPTPRDTLELEDAKWKAKENRNDNIRNDPPMRRDNDKEITRQKDTEISRDEGREIRRENYQSFDKNDRNQYPDNRRQQSHSSSYVPPRPQGPSRNTKYNNYNSSSDRDIKRAPRPLEENWRKE